MKMLQLIYRDIIIRVSRRTDINRYILRHIYAIEPLFYSLSATYNEIQGNNCFIDTNAFDTS